MNAHASQPERQGRCFPNVRGFGILQPAEERHLLDSRDTGEERVRRIDRQEEASSCAATAIFSWLPDDPADPAIAT